MKGQNIEIVDRMKILGTIVDNSLSWDENCQFIIKKLNARMKLLRGVKGFGASVEEMVHFGYEVCKSGLKFCFVE